MTTASSTLLAAGTLCWNDHAGKVRVLLVRPAGRAEYGFPKGKVDPGETVQEAAVRETREETGLEVTLGASLGTSDYSLPAGRDKTVRYWSAEVGDDAVKKMSFRPNAEIAAAEWVSIRSARARMTHERDREVLDRFLARLEAGTVRTFAIVALRHGKTVPGSAWNGPDSSRPLEQIGIEQARSSARAIASYAPKRLISSTAARCMTTIEPLALLTGLDVKATPAISQDAHEEGVADIARVVGKRIKRRETSVLCSHGPVLPDILGEVAHLAGTEFSWELRRAAALAVGAFAVVHLSSADPGAGIVAIESHHPATPR